MRGFALASYVLLLACVADDGPLHAACEREADCGNLRCVADLERPTDLEPLPLRCAPAQGPGEQGSPCAAASECAQGLCLLAGACAAPCSQTQDCEESASCREVFARSSDRALQPVSACVAMVDLPKDGTMQIETRKQALSGAVDSIELPGIERPTLFVLQHLSDDRWPRSMQCRPPLCVRRLVARDSGTVLFDATMLETGPSPLNPVASGDELDPVVLYLPNRPGAPLSGDGYEVELQTEVAGDLRVVQLSRALAGQRLDLNVFYVGTPDWEPTGSRGPPALEQALEEVDRIYAQADVFIGEVRQLTVPGGLPDRGLVFEPDGDGRQGFARIEVRFGVWAELPALLALSAGAANVAVNLFLVESIAAKQQGRPDGIAGGSPGPLGMHGTGGSGLAVGVAALAQDPVRLGRTIAHEIGHLLRLFHPSEADGRVLEALPDTPGCGVERDTDGDGQLSLAECGDAGASNLMFHSAAATGSELSPQQRDLIRQALILQ